MLASAQIKLRTINLELQAISCTLTIEAIGSNIEVGVIGIDNRCRVIHICREAKLNDIIPVVFETIALLIRLKVLVSLIGNHIAKVATIGYWTTLRIETRLNGESRRERRTLSNYKYLHREERIGKTCRQGDRCIYGSTRGLINLVISR